ncbi:uncharacterized protein [Chelonus insularis]|uniref:uncharacterized protein n=1 Tax=Chelonus insularis TaxID=460826 RepID=UPI0015889B74|nr:uncharacterized protein LOC118063746 [Chelonus insularis]XP_034933788.1 uncharacterized protein LOC118063746 [Chelonus insularis]XP_034933789.1 uncharacterized protein LOC118063746 [Chelonus insularis]XP_034933790.1 uncharacterized protein LOC118063746 [Chelonus insularis]
MRIEAFCALIAVVWLTAFLWQPFASANNVTINRIHREIQREPALSNGSFMLEEHKQSYYKDIQEMLRREGGESGNPVDCCPSTVEVIQPTGGRNRQGLYVELYRDAENIQSFYEISCNDTVENKPCRFIDRKLANQSRCVQKYSYSYALIRDAKFADSETYFEHHRHRHKNHHHFPTLGADSPWKLDFIRVRSGCSCEVSPKLKKKKKPSAIKLKKSKTYTRYQRSVRENVRN